MKQSLYMIFEIIVSVTVNDMIQKSPKCKKPAV